MRLARCAYGSFLSEYATLSAPLATTTAAARHIQREPGDQRQKHADGLRSAM